MAQSHLGIFDCRAPSTLAGALVLPFGSSKLSLHFGCS
jgi:hypothetical protein